MSTNMSVGLTRVEVLLLHGVVRDFFNGKHDSCSLDIMANTGLCIIHG